MVLSKKAVADTLFAIQIVTGFTFGGSQFLRMLTTTQGVSVTWYATWGVFLVLNLALSFRAHAVQPSRVTWQTRASYLMWSSVIALDLGVMLWRDSWAWSARDSQTVVWVVVGVGITLGLARITGRSLVNPIVKGVIALFFKGVPQVALAINIAHMGGGGLAEVAVIGGNITICTRLGQIWFSYKEAGWDENRVGSAIGEIANALSWFAVTIVWFLK